ncbi:MAG: hypothetical protein KJ645_08250 [Planctomycetes bacterium]|nr:hypothetical protein [Planctomycetota bacterium]
MERYRPMGSMDEKRADFLEILCPCGHQFEYPEDDGSGEFACPACGRLHVLPRAGTKHGHDEDSKGDTTVQATPPLNRT